jgi:pimeloyl-ACP methyl ester carboxylesterase
MADTIPNAKHHIIKNAGHMVILEKPTETSAILAEFLSSISFNPGQAGKGRLF